MTKVLKPTDVVKFISEEKITFVDFKFVDPFGIWQHITIPAGRITEETFEDGIPFDGSSVKGWKAINESDMLLIPEADSMILDPFFMEPTISIVCHVVDPVTKELYDKCPKSIAKKAVDYLKSTGIGDTAYFGPEAEFFIFDEVKYKNTSNSAYYEVDSVEAHWNSDKDEETNQGHKIKTKGGYFPTSPIDQTSDIRAEMMRVLEELDFEVERGHHEVATAGQGEINYKFDELEKIGDKTLLFKYVLKNVAYNYGKYLTFLPKPLAGDNGSGMHSHFSIWKGGKNLFAGKEYSGLSETALYAIGGIIKHGKALAAITNPTTNSYHRLVPGFEAPVRLAYSFRNRSAAIRIPFVVGDSDKGKRIECRFPDASSNPYLTFSALLCAAIDGIKNKIHPGASLDKDIYAMTEKELKKVPQMPGSLQEAIDALKVDSKFLTESGVFSKDFIDMWVEFKQAEVDAIRLVPHPKEFELYGDV